MANFTQEELVQIQTIYNDINSRMSGDWLTALNESDKPVADGYAMMAELLKKRLENDNTLTDSERTEITYVMTWFQGAEKVNRGQGSFSTMIRTYSDTQGELRYGSIFGAEMMQKASNKIGSRAFDQIIENQSDDIFTIPSMNDIAIYDAIGVGEILFSRDKDDSAHQSKENSAWSGVPLFSVLGSDQTARILNNGQQDSFDTLTDLRDSMFLLESFRHAFTETFKGSVPLIALAASLSVTPITQPIATQLLNEIMAELGMFASRELADNFYDELMHYESADFDLFSSNGIQAIAEIFLQAMTHGHTAYDSIKSLIRYGNQNVLDALQGYYSDNVTTTNYENFVKIAYDLFKTVPTSDKENKVQWLPKDLPSLNTKASLNNAEGMAIRYALSKLDPIVLTGFDFTKHNQNGELNLYSQDNLNGMTKEYIDARSKMLIYKQAFIDVNKDFDERLSFAAGIFLAPVFGDHLYQDLTTGLNLDIDGINPLDEPPRVSRRPNFLREYPNEKYLLT